jgi:hypothetical protein
VCNSQLPLELGVHGCAIIVQTSLAPLIIISQMEFAHIKLAVV